MKTQIKKSGFENFEKSLKRLEEIVRKLEDGSVTLDQAMNLYEEGVEISRECMGQLSKAEVKLKLLSKTVAGQFEVVDEPEEE